LAANRKFAAEHATRQRIVNALQTTQFRQRITIRCKTHNSAANHSFAAQHTTRQ
jgi:hypothetical protein